MMSTTDRRLQKVKFAFVVTLVFPLTMSDSTHKDIFHANYTEDIFLEQLFQKYGHDGVITFEGFEHLLLSLGLGNFTIEDHDVHDHFLNSSFINLHNDHDHGPKTAKDDRKDGDDDQTAGKSHEGHHAKHGHDTKSTQHQQHHDHHNHHDDTSSHHQHGRRNNDKHSGKHHHHQHQTTRKHKHRKQQLAHAHSKKDSLRSKRSVPGANTLHKCLTATQILGTIRPFLVNNTISEDMFLRICPAIVMQIDAHACSRPPCMDVHENLHCDQYHKETSPGHHIHHVTNTTSARGGFSLFEITPEVWGYATASVLVISFVGMLGVAVVPLMQMMFYNHVIQFMVALAVGTLTGDAFLHLLPHSLAGEESSHGSGDHSHTTPVMKGLTGLAGIYVFFLAEQILGFASSRRRKRKEQRILLRKVAEYEMQEMVAERLSGHHQNRSNEHLATMPYTGTDDHLLHERVPDDGDTENSDGCHGDNGQEYSHGHSGGHGHSHAVPKSIAAAAWMVVMGDGLHNFTDGIAIGAAFAQSFTAGLSTSIAIFCHELPHELGDFAVLIKAGMTVRQAFVCNVVSSVLALLGMIIGVAIGNISGVSLWVFALIGGLFIYIALVDMFPEMKYTEDQGIGRCCHLILLNLGLLSGIGIMLTIALFEDKIKVPTDMS